MKTLIFSLLIAGVTFAAGGCKPKASPQKPSPPIQAASLNKRLQLTDLTLANMIEEIQLDNLTYQEAAKIAMRCENANVSIDKMTGDFLIYKGINRHGETIRAALRRNKKEEESDAAGFRTVEEFYDQVRTAKFDSRDPLMATGFFRIAGTAHFTTRNGVMIELPRIETVPEAMVETLPPR